jgi:hypothetical protein
VIPTLSLRKLGAVAIVAAFAFLALLSAPPTTAYHGGCNGATPHVAPNDTRSGTITHVYSAHSYYHEAEGPVSETATVSPQSVGHLYILEEEDCDILCYATGSGTIPCSVSSGTGFVVMIAISDFTGGGDYTLTFAGQPIPECKDGVDNDGDGQTDSPADFGCSAPSDGTEAPNPACSDGLDNDGDGETDYLADPGCSGPRDNNEFAECDPTADLVTFCLAPGDVVVSETLRQVDTVNGPQHDVAGYVDSYRFFVPPGIIFDAPCVTLIQDGSEVNPCQQAGGRFVSRVSTLLAQTFREPQAQQGDEVATVSVCEAELVLLVGTFGVQSAPAYSLC